MNARIADRLVDQLYVEAMLLADETRSYFDGVGKQDRDALPPADRVGFACEAMRASTRLMVVVAWLLVRRAVACGEIGRADGGLPRRRLGVEPISDPADLARLPPAARRLCDDTIRLFDRIARIDRSLGPTAPANPVREMWARLGDIP